MGELNESRENARASGEAARGRGVLARLASLAQIGELARRLISESQAVFTLYLMAREPCTDTKTAPDRASVNT